jgi:hypothetical protein
MLILGSLLWRTTGVGAPPAPPADTAVRPSGGFPANDRARSREEISRARERFGIRDDVAQALAAVAQRQAEASLTEQTEADEQKRFDELYRELQLRSIEFEARYLEALAGMREAFLEETRRNIKKRQEEEDLMLLMMLAAAVAS